MKLLNYLPLLLVLIIFSCKSEPIEIYQDPFSSSEFTTLKEVFVEDRKSHKARKGNFTKEELNKIPTSIPKKTEISIGKALLLFKSKYPKVTNKQISKELVKLL